ncbi:MAG: hypothetical protein CMK59_02550 [Proteobacteria bacterium]|nr:hypothetical protein [Pseudomonadota bacterium]
MSLDLKQKKEIDPKATLGGTLLLETLFSDDELQNLQEQNTDVQEEMLQQEQGSFTLGMSQFSPVKSEMNSPRYVYEHSLGEGAYGKVWKAKDSDIGRSVAIKSYKFKGAQGHRICSAELSIAGKIDHPGVPVVYDITNSQDDSYHVVMKYIDGVSLEDIIELLKGGCEATHAKYRYDLRIELMLQLLRILASIHKMGIIHRDIKPENILIGENGEAYLMDWGIALDLKQSDGEGQLAGTPNYMSPEQAASLPLDKRADLYAMAAVFYEFMSLRRSTPEAENTEELLLKLIGYEPTVMDLWYKAPVQGYYPRGFLDFFTKGLKKSPQERFQSAEDMIQEIHDINNGKMSPSCPFTALMLLNNRIHKAFQHNPIRTGFVLMLVGMILMITLIGVGVVLGVSYFNSGTLVSI